MLHLNLTDLKRNKDFFRESAQTYLARVQEKVQTEKGVEGSFQKLLLHRQQVFENEISKNPMGQILEPGFRVIFPVPGN